MIDKPKHIWLIWVAITSGLAAHILHYFIPHFMMLGADRSIYHILIALALLSFSLFCFLNFMNGLMLFAFVLTANKFANETIFNPLEFRVGEIGFVLCVTIGIYAYLKTRQYDKYN